MPTPGSGGGIDADGAGYARTPDLHGVPTRSCRKEGRVDERLYIVTYDISSRRRWRHVFRTMEGYGEWLQLSVFQCRLTAKQRVEMVAALDTLIHHGDDHVLIVDLGPADKVSPRVESLGKRFDAVAREPIIV